MPAGYFETALTMLRVEWTTRGSSVRWVVSRSSHCRTGSQLPASASIKRHLSRASDSPVSRDSTQTQNSEMACKICAHFHPEEIQK